MHVTYTIMLSILRYTVRSDILSGILRYTYKTGYLYSLCETAKGLMIQ